MIDQLARWLIARASCRGAAWPGWVQRRIDRDADLARFAAAMRGLESRLRDEAGAWAAAQPASLTSSAPTVPRAADPPMATLAEPRSRVRRRQAIALAVAASLAAVGALVWLTRDQSPQLARSTNETSGDVENYTPLATSWLVGREQLEAAARAMHAWAAPVAALDWPDVDGALLANALTRARSPQLAAAVASAVAAERRELKDGAQAAVRFFTRRLPQSVMVVFGVAETSPPPELEQS